MRWKPQIGPQILSTARYGLEATWEMELFFLGIPGDNKQTVSEAFYFYTLRNVLRAM